MLKSTAFAFIGTLLANQFFIHSAYAEVETAEHCTQENAHAIYNIQQTPINGTPSTHTLQIYRSSNQAAIVYPEKNITELWERARNGRLHLVHYFNQYQRGIEYQENEIKGNHDWSLKQQLVSNSFINAMTLINTTKEGCQRTQEMTRSQGGVNYHLFWLENAHLPRTFDITTPRSHTRWQLTSLQHNADTITNFFTTLNTYPTTDYTDIGDNESDPFLMKMINLGFVEHGNSGFYDADGNDIGQHHH